MAVNINNIKFMDKKFITLENDEMVKLSDIKKITKNYSSKHTDGFEPFISIKKGEAIFRFLGLLPIKFAKKDCFKLDPYCNGRYGSWYNKYYYSLEELFNSMIEHWGELSPGAFGGYNQMPNAEYCAGWYLTDTKDALYFDSKENAICVKPYITLWFDNFEEYYSGLHGHVCPRRKFIMFSNNEELDKWIADNIGCMSLLTCI